MCGALEAFNQLGGRKRDLALFNLAIDSKLRGCDLVSLKVEDVAPSGRAVRRSTIRQKKTGRPVQFELTEPTRQAVDDYLAGRIAARRLHVHRSSRAKYEPHDTPVRASPIKLDRRHRIGSISLRHTLPAAHQGNLDLSPNRQSTGGPVVTRPYQGGKHRPIPRRRTR